jgi:PAS domain S-box-containing protein
MNEELPFQEPTEPFGPGLIQEIIDVMQDGIVIVDALGRILATNLVLETLAGYARGSLVGEPVEVLVPERLRTKHVLLRTTYERTPRIHRRMGIEIFARHADGHEIPVIADLAPLQDGARQLTMAFIRFRETPAQLPPLLL